MLKPVLKRANNVYKASEIYLYTYLVIIKAVELIWPVFVNPQRHYVLCLVLKIKSWSSFQFISKLMFALTWRLKFFSQRMVALWIK